MATGLLTCAIFTSLPCCNMGVITMKIISSTSITSTMGVTFISELTLAPSLRVAIAIRSFSCAEPFTCWPLVSEEPGVESPQHRVSNSRNHRSERWLAADSSSATLQEVINQFAGRIVHLHIERFYASGEVVEHHDGGDGHEKTDGRRHQGFRNAACDRTETGGLAGRNFAERVQNTEHSSEQADERGSGADGGQAAQSALEFSVNDSFSALQSALGSFDDFAWNLAAVLVRAEFHEASGDYLGQMAL